jgi:hypothetical protein
MDKNFCDTVLNYKCGNKCKHITDVGPQYCLWNSTANQCIRGDIPQVNGGLVYNKQKPVGKYLVKRHKKSCLCSSDGSDPIFPNHISSNELYNIWGNKVQKPVF